jgi:MYXO-CTERM domain-containing protein
LFRDVFRRSGAIVLSSSRGGELSYEDDAIGNGMFTHALLRALTTAEADADGDGSVMIRELRDYVAAKVAALTGDQQHPTIDRDNRHVQLGFPITKATTSIWTPPAAPRGARGCGCSGAGPDAPGAFLLLIVGFGVSFRRRQPPN